MLPATFCRSDGRPAELWQFLKQESISGPEVHLNAHIFLVARASLAISTQSSSSSNSTPSSPKTHNDFRVLTAFLFSRQNSSSLPGPPRQGGRALLAPLFLFAAFFIASADNWHLPEVPNKTPNAPFAAKRRQGCFAPTKEAPRVLH